MRKLYEGREKTSRRGRAVIEEQLRLLRVLPSWNKAQSQMQGIMAQILVDAEQLFGEPVFLTH